MKKHNIAKLIFYILSAEAIGALSAFLSGGFSDFFDKYIEPPLLPPAWLFPVVWTVLYALMGISAYIISENTAQSHKRDALSVYWAQLIFNFSWSIVFFRFEKLWLAVIIILILLALIITMIINFRKINKTASNLNIPYLIWVAFATYLNIATALIN